MDIKPRPNHSHYLEALKKMTPQQKLDKVYELSEMGKQLFKQGLRKRFPEKSEEEIRKIYLERIALCHNRNW